MRLITDFSATSSLVTFSKSSELSEPQFPHLSNEEMVACLLTKWWADEKRQHLRKLFGNCCNRVQQGWRANAEHNCSQIMIHYLPLIKKNQGGQLFSKTPILSLILLIHITNWLPPDDGYKLSKFKCFPLKVHKGTTLSFSTGRQMCICFH